MPEIVAEPHYKYADWPGKTTIYYEQGVARLQNMHDGAHLFIAIGGAVESNACLTLEETEHLYEQLGHALEEQRQLVAKEAELSAPFELPTLYDGPI